MSTDVTRVGYRPHDHAYRLDVEVIDAESLRSRVASAPERGFERVDFQCFLFVRSGTYTHTIDFETHFCTAGSCLLIGPGQVHRFGPTSEWEGWILIVESPHVPAEIDQLPSHIKTSEPLAAAIVELFERMSADTSSAIERTQLNDLLAVQAQLLARRLFLGYEGRNPLRLIDPAAISRYREYRAAIDQHFRQWHLVTSYARHLGLSTKSLNRSCRATSDATAKQLIVERIILEAKRLLAHSGDPVESISAFLGFDEPTNFIKFFKRRTGLTPTQFRRSLRAAAE